MSCFQIGSFSTQDNFKEIDCLGVQISYIYVRACFKMKVRTSYLFKVLIFKKIEEGNEKCIG